MRPFFIVSHLVLYVPLTSQNRGSPYEVVLPKLPFLERDSVANVQGLGSVATVRLEGKFGRLSEEIMLQVKEAISFALDLKTSHPQDSPD